MNIAIVIPCYNEEEVLPKTVAKMEEIVERAISDIECVTEVKVVFVDDGSRDATWKLIQDYAHRYDWVGGIRLSRNYGHQNALLAGLERIDADAYITMDADLQDDPDVSLEMMRKFCEGFDVVYGVRSERKTDTWFKRFTAEGFYKLMAWMGVESVYNHADYRLLSRRAKEALEEFHEVNLFLRGIIPLIGFKSTKVYYKREERQAGESKYPLKKMLSFAWEGITSFSTVPLRLISWIGFIIFIIALLLGGWALYEKLFTDHAAPGWTSLMIVFLGLGGIQMLSLGIIGEYIGKIYREVKHRPRYFIDETEGIGKFGKRTTT